MIIYFSGTGNSRAVATMLATLTADHVYPLVDTPPAEAGWHGERLILVMPVYSWGIPPLVGGWIAGLNEEFLARARRHGATVVLTCGDETGRAPQMIEKALQRAGIPLRGLWDVIMPNNYVLLPGFDVDSKEVEREKLSRYPARVEQIAEAILAGQYARDYTAGSWPRLKSGLVYPLFVKMGIVPSRWLATDACVGCGLCERICPMRNITLTADRTPRWGSRCVSCLGCYHVCPRNAVQYGKATRGKGQYLFPRH